MTTIIRANGVIANPQPGGLLLPRLGVSGVVARWHASGQGGPGAITTVKDVTGRGNDLPVTSGAVSVALVGGRPALDFGAAGAGNAASIASIQGTNKKRSIAVLFQLAAFPAAASYMLATTNPAGNNCGIGVVYGNNRICTYGNAGATLSSGAPTALNTWIAAVGTFDDDALQAGGNSSKIANGSNIVEGSITYAIPGTLAAFALRGNAALAPKFMDAAIFDRVLTNEEMGIVSAALLSQVAV
ncbi:hypothetical protein [Stenotrophomonas sp. NPDC078853]|uniref:hypothetical protein n=1 Tax=Stenotrophomonas sp. NPDC078853 TaxID=3364534 RepID=UPI0038516D6B